MNKGDTEDAYSIIWPKNFKQKCRSQVLPYRLGGGERGHVTLLSRSQRKSIDNVETMLHLAHEVQP